MIANVLIVVGREFNLMHHIARMTFASTILLFNNVPMEVVSELLGHSKMQTTQDSYASIVQKRISLEVERLKHPSELINKKAT